MPPPRADAMRRVFLSFSGDDAGVVRSFHQALKQSGVLSWDYSNPDEALPIGTPIAEELKARIVACDDFIVFVSDSSLDERRGYFVHVEVAHAIASGFARRKRLLPVVIDEARARAWPEPFASLADLLYVDVRRSDPESVEAAMARLFAHFDLKREPGRRPHPRLPLSERLRGDLERAGARNLTVHEYNEALKIAADYESSYREGRYEEALESAEFLRMHLKRARVPMEGAYYVLVAQGICELHLARLLQAEETFRRLVQHVGADESAFSGLGLVLLRLGRNTEARDAFAGALARRPDDAVALYNLHLADYVLGRPPSTQWPLPSLDDFDDVERPDVRNLLASIALRSGSLQEAWTLLDGVPGESAMIQRAEVQRDKSGARRALRELEPAKIGPNMVGAWRTRARLLLEAGRSHEGLDIYERYLSDRLVATREIVMERAIVHYCLDDVPAAARVSGWLVDSRPIGLPESGADFYWEGLANFILGRLERAEGDRARASGHGTPYAQLLGAGRLPPLGPCGCPCQCGLGWS